MNFFVLVAFLSVCNAVVYDAVARLSPVNASLTKFSGLVTFTTGSVETDPLSMNLTISGTGLPDGDYGLALTSFGDLRGLIKQQYVGTLGVNMVGGGSAGPGFACIDITLSGGNVTSTEGPFALSLSGASSIVGLSVALLNTPCGSGFEIFAFGVIGIAQVTGDTNGASPAPGTTSAVCVFEGTSVCKATPNQCTLGSGLATLQTVDPVTIKAQVKGWTPSSGFHIHQFGDLTKADGSSAGAHLNLGGFEHGLPGVNPERHTGDLGYFFVEEGDSFYNYDFPVSGTSADNLMSLDNFIGRSMIVHSLIDHGRNGSNCTAANTTGASGVRIYQCVIGIANTADQEDPDNTLPVTDAENRQLANNWAPSACSSGPERIAFVRSSNDCANNRYGVSLINNISLCQYAGGGIYMRVACSEFQGLTGSVACTDANCRLNCIQLTAPPRVCTADGFGTAYTYECSGTKVYVSFLLLVFAFMFLW